MKLTRHGKTFARALLHKGGLMHGARFLNRGAVRVLMYHDFPDLPGNQERLNAQCKHIQKFYQIVSLSDVAQFLRHGKALPANALVVTVDDGNRDFLLNGYPVFHAHKIPVTVFLVSGFLDGKLWLWWDQIIYMIENSPRRVAFDLALGAGSLTTYPLRTDEERQATLNALTIGMKFLDPQDRVEALHQLSESLEVSVPEQPPLSMAAMTWEEVRTASDNGVEFGAHTVTHPVLSRINDLEQLRTEILKSKTRIEEEIKKPVRHFCYPFGRWGDFNDETIKVVDESGFETASSAQYGLITPQTHPYQLTRLSVDPSTSEYYFQERLAGLHDG